MSVRNGILGDPGGPRSFAKRHSHLYRLVSKALHALAPSAIDDRYGTMQQLARQSAWAEPPLAAAVPAFQEAIEAIAATAAGRHIDLRALVIPTRETVDASARGLASRSDWDPVLPNRKAAAILSAAGIPFVDVTDVLAKSDAGPNYLPLDGHLTPLGNRIVADAVRALLADPAPARGAGAR